MFEPSAELSVMMDAARAAGRHLAERFRKRGAVEVRLKGPGDFVTTADLESEQTLRSMLLAKYGDHAFVGEESSDENAGRGSGGAAARFIVDPLDGTTNFLHGVPHFAVSIALERDGRTTCGVVFDVPKNEMFVVEAGRGAWLGDERLRVSNARDLSHSIVGTGIPHSNAARGQTDPDRYLAILRGVMREAAGVRRFAAAALDLAYVAAGRFAAFFEYGLSPWDIAAGALLVREAGGQVSEPDGGDGVLRTGNVLATNAKLHPKMIELLGEHRIQNIKPSDT